MGCGKREPAIQTFAGAAEAANAILEFEDPFTVPCDPDLIRAADHYQIAKAPCRNP